MTSFENKQISALIQAIDPNLPFTVSKVGETTFNLDGVEYLVFTKNDRHTEAKERLIREFKDTFNNLPDEILLHFDFDNYISVQIDERSYMQILGSDDELITCVDGQLFYIYRKN